MDRLSKLFRAPRAAAALLMAVVVVATSGCAPQQPPTPEEVRDSLVDTVAGTRDLFPDMEWTMLANGIPAPRECKIHGEEGVDFSANGHTSEPGADPAAAAEAVENYWRSLGIRTRRLSEPSPTVFGEGGPVKAISFSTDTRYSISAGGHCAPGNDLDHYHDYDNTTPPLAPPVPTQSEER